MSDTLIYLPGKGFILRKKTQDAIWAIAGFLAKYVTLTLHKSGILLLVFYAAF
jgi:hypothetical protein